jgi:hypothetical protein
MSASDSKLTVRMADDAAEISVIDGNFNTVARGIGTVEQVLPRGLYKLRIRVGPSVEEELIALDQDKELDRDTLAFPSAIPLNQTSRSHEYHQAAARQASNTARVKLGTGASVLVFAREWSGPKSPLQANPATGLTFWKERGDKPQDIANQADVSMRGDA